MREEGVSPNKNLVHGRGKRSTRLPVPVVLQWCLGLVDATHFGAAQMSLQGFTNRRPNTPSVSAFLVALPSSGCVHQTFNLKT